MLIWFAGMGTVTIRELESSRSRRLKLGRTATRVAALGVLVLLGLAPNPSPGYDFYPPGVTSSAGAVRWEVSAFPLRFRMLDTGAFPEYAGLNAEIWRDIVLRGISAWVEVETADVSIVLEAGTLVGRRGRHRRRDQHHRFEAREEWDHDRASALVVWTGRRTTGCDVLFDPAIFDGWPEDDPRIVEWTAHFSKKFLSTNVMTAAH